MTGSFGLELAYLVGACCFIVGLKMLASPRTAVSGNLVGSLGMLIVAVATVTGRATGHVGLIGVALAVGAVLGLILALRIPMTMMPEMVGVLNGFGGAASAMVATAEILERVASGQASGPITTVPIILGVVIGWVTLTGSLVAAGKLKELIPGRPITYPLQNVSNIVFGLVLASFAIFFIMNPSSAVGFWGATALALLLGVLIVIPIGGGDMPVVICLMNSYSGLAACATGFALNNSALIISGSLVGSSGMILTVAMCKAMNRSVYNVFFGAFGQIQSGGASAAAGGSQAAVRSATVEDICMLLDAANRVVIVPGYGMAVAQAQHAVRELAEILSARGIEVDYAIHPVAGRMPGHMNVLLAEANVPYEKLLELDQVNPLFPECDVAFVVGANDIVNPAARHDKTSPIFGMPILDADKARTIIAMKRSMRPGFAGIDNELYTNPKTLMFFGDAKKQLLELVNALKTQ